jgi:glycosyltransferase involved in cell wall biosynthesis
VSFLGRVSPQEKLELLKRSWAIAYTSVMEGWGLGILEAAACGTPALGYDSGATKEAIIDNETGLLTTYGDIEGLANIMYRMLTESQLRERLTRGALSFASQFDWDRAASQTLSILEDSCKG